MKIFLVVDGSNYSDMATHVLKALWLPAETEVTCKSSGKIGHIEDIK